MNSFATIAECLNTRPDEYRYLLIDPLKPVMLWNPLHPDCLTEKKGPDFLRRVLRPDLAWSPEHCPLLVLLASPGENCDKRIIEESEQYALGELLYEKRYVCGWMSALLTPEEMAKWLVELCKKIRPGAIVPVFEPLRLELLGGAVDPAQFATLLAPLSQWIFLSVTGERRVLSGAIEGKEWQLNWGAEQALDNIRDIWRLLSAWSHSSESLPPDAARQAEKAWKLSGKVGLNHLSDRLLLALDSLTLPTSVTTHSDMKVLLQKVASNPNLHLTQLMKTLPKTVWQEQHSPEAKTEGIL